MKMLIDDLKIDTIVAGFNGGVFVKPDLTVIQSRFISRAAAARALEVIGQHKLVAWLYTDQQPKVTTRSNLEPDPSAAVDGSRCFVFICRS
jgi:hydroxymethylpyrimidine pyrophosphatase-like HAD family hydrolase